MFFLAVANLQHHNINLMTKWTWSPVSVCESAYLVSTKIFTGWSTLILSNHARATFIVPRGWILMASVIFPPHGWHFWFKLKQPWMDCYEISSDSCSPGWIVITMVNLWLSYQVHFVQYFGFWSNTCEYSSNTNEVLVVLAGLYGWC